MTNREVILGRIREALQNPSPPPVYDGTVAALVKAPPSSPPVPRAPARTEQETTQQFRASARAWLPPVGPTLDEQIELFRQNALGLKAEFQTFPDIAAAAGHVQTLAKAGGWKKIGVHSGALTDPVGRALGLREVRTDAGYKVEDLESCDAGVTECEVLIAQTGSVLVSCPSAGGRALSVLPPHHVVLARRAQMVSDLTAAFEFITRKYGGKFPSFLSFITGPSRTGDIERILVLGAHGPKRLSILLV
jgi:L-lactate dehydrogenase complex protein LldG